VALLAQPSTASNLTVTLFALQNFDLLLTIGNINRLVTISSQSKKNNLKISEQAMHLGLFDWVALEHNVRKNA
jgi:hypothetical protein